ncbi:MAG TPA: CPBP family intramembrane metalloprotease [Myxococcales bacterium]|nr:CPBP family intramembrane metalloprotease [Myxococcales bacterium]
MIRWPVVRTLIVKELLEVVRDRRSVFLMIVLPLLLYPLIFLATTTVAMHQLEVIEAEPASVASVGAAMPAELRNRIEALDNLTLAKSGGAWAEERLSEGTIHVLIQMPLTTPTLMAAEKTVDIRLLYDETNETSLRARVQVREAIGTWNQDLIAVRLARHGLESGVAQPVTVASENVAPPAKVGGHLMGRILPLLIVLMVILGAFYPAIEVTAGEKERGTLQTLLTAPIRSIEIVTGKYVAVFCVAAVTGASNILAMASLFAMAAFLPEQALEQIDFALTATQILMMGVVVVVIGFLFSAIMMTVAVLAKTFKEAQSYMTPVYLLCVVPVVFAQLPGMNLEGALQVAPGINLALLLRFILEGTATVQQGFVVLVSSLVYTAATLVLAARIFERQSILLGHAGLSAVFESKERNGILPSTGEGLALAAIVFILLFYVGSVVQAWHLIAGMAVTQWILILMPVLIFLRWKKLPIKQALGLMAPSSRSLVAAAILGSSLWYPISLAMQWLVSKESFDSPQFRALEDMLMGLLDGSPLWLLVLVLAVSPAICEEILFRGFVMRSLMTSMRAKTAIIISALLFGAFHMSAARFLPTTVLGVVLGFLAFRGRSLIPAMLFHGLHNGITVLIHKQGWPIPGITSEQAPSLLHLTVSLVLVSIGVSLIAGVQESVEDPPQPVA